jgi:hypothetical protein
VIVPVKTGANGGFEVEALNGATGSVLWTQTTDYVLPPHNWTPSYSPVLTAQNRLYFAGAGGTLYYLDNPDTPGPHAVGHLAFYGISNYLMNAGAYNSTVFIDTPLTADSQGNIFFGFRVVGSAPGGLVNGIARIGANGSGTSVSASSAVADPSIGMAEVPHNMAPALSNDETTLYVGIRSVSTAYYARHQIQFRGSQRPAQRRGQQCRPAGRQHGLADGRTEWRCVLRCVWQSL